jgi:phosphoglucomutase
VKFYFGVNGTSLEESKDKLKKVEQDFMQLVEEKMEAAAKTV